MSKVPLASFIRTYELPLGLFVSKVDLMHLAHALNEGVGPDGMVLRRCITASSTTASMFKDLTKKSQYVLFVATINERLRQLELHNFDATELSNFSVVMSQEV